AGPDGRGEHHPAGAHRGEEAGPGMAPGAPAGDGDGGPPRAPALGAVGRRAAAGRGGAGAAQPPRRRLRRRADREPRHEGERRGAGTAAQGGRRLWADDRDGHPRRLGRLDGGRGAVSGRRPDHRPLPPPDGRADPRPSEGDRLIRLALRGMTQRKLRSTLTALAVLLGVSMISGTYVLTDGIRDAFHRINETANRGSDAVLTPETAFTSTFTQQQTMPVSLLDRVRRLPEVASAAGQHQAYGALVVDGKEIGAAHGAPSLVFSLM